MITNTKYFGSVAYDKQDLIQIPDGIYGFESCRNFLLIHFNPDNANLLCLQSLEDEHLAFVLVNPFTVCQDYNPKLSREDMEALQLTPDSDVTFYAFCVVCEPVDASTVNLKCPLTINPLTRHARQIILDDTAYDYRHPLGNHQLG